MTFTAMPIPPDPIGKSNEVQPEEVLQVFGNGQSEAAGTASGSHDDKALFKDVIVSMEEDDWKIYNEEEPEDRERKRKLAKKKRKKTDK